ncbi:MAG: hypothetical protein AB7F40_11440 [Victivallaceae bacterium]
MIFSETVAALAAERHYDRLNDEMGSLECGDMELDGEPMEVYDEF